MKYYSRQELEGLCGKPGGRYDVIVAGGGPAGLGAALASAKTGAKTLLLEARGFLGGVAATSLWMPINRLLLGGRARGPVHGALSDRLIAWGEDACIPGKVNAVDGDGLSVHPDYLRLAALEALEEFGCEYLLYSPATDVIMDSGRMRGVVSAYKSVRSVFIADIVIDCTGDGDLCFMAGARTEHGREGDGKTMSVTLGFALANVDIDRFTEFYPDISTGNPKMLGYMARAQADGLAVAEWYVFDRTTLPGVISVNNGGLKDIGILDATNPAHLTIAERGGLQAAHDFVKMARRYAIPGLENCKLARTGAALGVRETRRVMCDYVLTMEDAESGREFEDVVARRYGALDAVGLDAGGRRMKSGYGYPWRGFLVSGIEGLLAAGRCGSYTQMALAAGKSMGNMIELGQAAGAGGALASQKGITPRELDYRALQTLLRGWGVRL